MERSRLLPAVVQLSIDLGMIEIYEEQGVEKVRLTEFGRTVRDMQLPAPKFLNPSYVESFQ